MLKMQTDVAKVECVVILFKYLTVPYGGGQVLFFFITDADFIYGIWENCWCTGQNKLFSTVM